MDTKHILLVEDDSRDAELTLTALADPPPGNKVVLVHDGAEALDYLYCRGKFKTRSSGNPIVVLLDNKMPKVSGLEVLKTIKADGHLKTIPVVALTSSRETRDLIEFYKYGANAYVVKPVSFSEFTKAVQQLGIFWGAVNEPPPYAGGEETSLQSGGVILPAQIDSE
jgi:CheY-like chemotaxis protein